MRNILIIAFLAVFSLSVPAQNANADNLQRKKEAEHQQIIKLVEKQSFMLAANNLSNKYGSNWYVNPNTNFVLMDSTLGVIQYALPFSQNFGYNGLGGLTFDGRITSYQIRDRGVGKGVALIINLFGSIPVDLFFDISDSGWTNITISGIHGGKLRMRGKLQELNSSDYFQGSLIY